MNGHRSPGEAKREGKEGGSFSGAYSVMAQCGASAEQTRGGGAYPRLQLRRGCAGAALAEIPGVNATHSIQTPASQVPPRPHVVETLISSSLWGVMKSYQDGLPGAIYGDGDRASMLGHLGLIRMQAYSGAGMMGTCERPLRFTHAAMDEAASGGRLEVVRWLHHHRQEGGTSRALIQAAANCHAEVVDWLLSNRGENDVWRAITAAIAGASPSACGGSNSSGVNAAAEAVVDDDRIGTTAAAGAHSASSSLPSSPRPNASAPRNGNFYRGRRESLFPAPCVEAGATAPAEEHHRLLRMLESLRLALPPGFAELSVREWVSGAASIGRLDILEWLRMVQHKQIKERLKSAQVGKEREARGGRGAEMQVGQQMEYDLPRLEYPRSALADAARGGHVQVLEWFLENGVCSDDPIQRRVSRRRWRSPDRNRARTPTSSEGRGGSGVAGRAGVDGDDGGSSGGAGGNSSEAYLRNSKRVHASISSNPSLVATAPMHGSFLPDATDAPAATARAAHVNVGENGDQARGGQGAAALSTGLGGSGRHRAGSPGIDTTRSKPTVPLAISTRGASGPEEEPSKALILRRLLRKIPTCGGGGGNDGGRSLAVAPRRRSEGESTSTRPRTEGRQATALLLRRERKLLNTTFAVEDAAAAAGHLEVLEWLNTHAKPGPRAAARHLPQHHHRLPRSSPSWRSRAAANLSYRAQRFKNRSPSLFRNARASSAMRCSRRALETACEAGHSSVAVWLASHRSGEVEKAYDCLNKAAAMGHLELVSWLRTSHGWNPSPYYSGRWARATTAAMDNAAAGGHLQVVRWIHSHCPEGCTSAAMDGAAAAGHLPVVEWLHQHRTEGCTVKAMDLAAAAGHLDVVKWLHNNRDEGCTTAAMDGAAEHNHLRTLEWLRQNREEGWTMLGGAQGAARNGNLAALSYLLLGDKDDAVDRYDDGFGGLSSTGGTTTIGDLGFGVRTRVEASLGVTWAFAGCLDGGNDDHETSRCGGGARYCGFKRSGTGGGGGGDGCYGCGWCYGNEGCYELFQFCDSSWFALEVNQDGGGGVDRDGDGGNGNAVHGLMAAEGGGRVESDVITLDLDEAAAEGRLDILRWARLVTLGRATRLATTGVIFSDPRVTATCRCRRYLSDTWDEKEDETKEGENEDWTKKPNFLQGQGNSNDDAVDSRGGDIGFHADDEERGGAASGVPRRGRHNGCQGRAQTQRSYEGGDVSLSYAMSEGGAATKPGVRPVAADIATNPVSRSTLALLSGTPADAPLPLDGISDAATFASIKNSDFPSAASGGVSDSTACDVSSASATDFASSAGAGAIPSARSTPPPANGDGFYESANVRSYLHRSRRRYRCCYCRYCECRRHQEARSSVIAVDDNGWRKWRSPLIPRGDCVGDWRNRGVQARDRATGMRRPSRWALRRDTPRTDLYVEGGFLVRERGRYSSAEREEAGGGGGMGRESEEQRVPTSRAGTTRFKVAFSTAAVDGAAKRGHLEVVRWLLFHRGEGGTPGAINGAAANGHTHVLDLLDRRTSSRVDFRGCSPLNPSALDLAAGNGHLQVIRWFHCKTKTSSDAATSTTNNVGGRDSSKSKVFDGFTYRLIDEAASNGHLQICQWLRQHRGEGCSWNAFDGAAAGGHMHVLNWLDEHYRDIGPSAVAFVQAAKAGHFHIVQWLLQRYPKEAESGCMWAHQELSEASEIDHWPARKWKTDRDVLELLKTARTSRFMRRWCW